MAGKLDDAALSARKQRVAMLHVVARLEGADKDYAARLRAEGRMMADDPDFADMERQHARYTEIANIVTAETEALHDRQSARAKKRRPRPWHAAADPILDELRGKHPEWSRSGLRRELKKRLEKLGGKFPGADAIEARIMQREKDGSLAKRAK
jgi:hypothetical protein